MTAADGLWLFLTMTFIVLAGLAYDVFLWQFDYPTITDFCRRHWWAACLVLFLKFLGLVGLGFHFFGPGDKKL